MKSVTYLTTDLCDEFEGQLDIAQPIFKNFGANHRFHGLITTVKVFEDNVLVKQMLGESSDGGVLVVDGGGSTRCALLGDMLAGMAVENGWSGIVVNGCIRDSAEISTIKLGVKALNVHPLKSIKRGEGQNQVPVHFAGITFTPGAYLYSDEDGIVVASKRLN